jgi:hypothetical protein
MQTATCPTTRRKKQKLEIEIERYLFEQLVEK